jgi:2-dehydropantoate 2-reductase
MRILVIGAGATGGFYGARLLQAGRDVHFLVRPARAAALRAHGLRIVSALGDATLHPPLLTAADVANGANDANNAGAPFDVVLFTVKAFGLAQAIADAALTVGPQTLIVPVLNGMRHIDALVQRFGQARVLGGVSHLATMLDDDGRIVQIAPLRRLAYGVRRAAGANAVEPERLQALHAALSGADYESRLSPDIDREMWEKWVFLASLGAINCLLRGSIGEIEAAPGGAELARAMLHECAAVAAACGHPLADAYLADSARTLTLAGSPQASSMYRDLRRGLDVEADHILGDLVQRARAGAIATPLLSAAYAQLCVYRNRRAAENAAG